MRTGSMRGLGIVVLLALSCSETFQPSAGVAVVRQSLATSFATGSLIIPMDTTFQDDGMIKAYGLVYALLRSGVPVHWAVKEAKANQASDFTASARDLVSMQVLTNTNYRGGPFIIDQPQRAQALPIIAAWQTANPQVVVHDATAAFSADIKLVLRAAPRVGVFLDGNELIAFRVLNAAGILDSAGQAWPAASAATYPTNVDVLSSAQVRGPTNGAGTDGALLRADGTPAWHFLISMHYDSPDTEVVREVRQWLTASPLAHAYMQCSAVTAFENDTNGRFLTTLGVRQETDTTCVLIICQTNNRNPPNPVVNRLPSSEFNQYDNGITIDQGALQSMGLAPGSALRAGVEVLLAGAATGDNRMAYVHGSMDGNAARGQVSYLVGHDYSTTMPISTHPLTNGSRLLLDSMFASSLTAIQGQPNVTLTKSGPTLTSANTLTWTIAYQNTGTGIAEDAVIKDTLPAGTTFSSASSPGTLTGNVVSWPLGTLIAGESGSVTVSVEVGADGVYANNAKLEYRVGLTPGVVTSNTVNTTRDATAPDTTLLTTPPAITNATTGTFTFSGTETGTFQCSLDGAAFAVCTSPRALTSLSEGSHTFRVRAVDAAGNADATPAAFTWVVDLTAPAAPVISQPSAGGTTSPRPAISGLAEPGSSVEVRVDGVLVATVPADPSTGAWSYTLTAGQALGNGAHSASAIAVDPAGNPSVASTRAFNVDTTQPLSPIITSPANGTAINTTTPLVVGTAPATSTVRVFVDGVLVGTVVSDAAGAWQYQLTAGQALSVGAHELSARTVSVTNVESAPAISLVTVDLTAPAAPAITAPTSGQKVNSSSPIVKGTSEPFATISVTLDANAPLTTVADASGAWSLQLTGVSEGNHQVAASARDTAGNLGPSSAAVPFVVDTTAPVAPVLLTPTAGQALSTARPVISGTSEAGATVEVFVDGVLVGSTLANGSGSWAFTPTVDVVEGSHVATAHAVDAAGNRSVESQPRAFTIDQTAPAAPKILSPTGGSLTRDSRPAITGTAEAGAIVTVTIDSVVVGTATADALGSWSFVPASALSDGTHSVSAHATDAAGNNGAQSASVMFGVDTVAPAAPVIITPTNGGTTSNPASFSGTAEPGAFVSVVLDGVVVATVLTDASGNWRFDSAAPIADGAHVVNTVAVDRAGNTSPASPNVSFTTVSPAADGGVDAGGDAGTGDAGVSDAGVTDAGITDAGITDAGITDAGITDAGIADAGITDAGMNDAGVSDAGMGDGGVRDAGSAEAFDYVGGGCGCSSVSGDMPWLLALGVALLRRRASRKVSPSDPARTV